MIIEIIGLSGNFMSWIELKGTLYEYAKLECDYLYFEFESIQWPFRETNT